MPRITTAQQMIDQILGDHTEGEPSVLLDGRTACKFCLCGWPCDAYKAAELVRQCLEAAKGPYGTVPDDQLDTWVEHWHKAPGSDGN